jgi:hypothetical protein
MAGFEVTAEVTDRGGSENLCERHPGLLKLLHHTLRFSANP